MFDWRKMAAPQSVKRKCKAYTPPPPSPELSRPPQSRLPRAPGRTSSWWRCQLRSGAEIRVARSPLIHLPVQNPYQMPASIHYACMQEIHPYKHMSLAKLHEAARDAAYLRCKIHNKVRISQGPYAVKAGRRPGSTSALGQTTSPAQRTASMVWRYLLRCAGDVARAG